jgi:hypothetical protein
VGRRNHGRSDESNSKQKDIKTFGAKGSPFLVLALVCSQAPRSGQEQQIRPFQEASQP